MPSDSAGFSNLVVGQPPAFEQMMRRWRTIAKPAGIRLGQFFVNNYMKSPFDALFYETDTNKAKAKILEIYDVLHWEK
jgi:hypothetical protein